jgi:hypothetical protein
MRLFFFLILYFLSTSFFPYQKIKDNNYRWPLNINNGYSSAFQEFRSTHFHAGMDLRTFQKTGFPVYAISSGHLFKIRVVKRGSGRGLYIKHHDGRTSIYFHLEKFARKIETITRQVQKSRRQKYFGNYFLKNPLPIKKGEVIGFSGETGYGFPHLHLEIRDREYFAINPFKCLIPPGKDFNFPILKALLFRIKEKSLINGHTGQKLIEFRKSRQNTFSLPHPIVFTGKFDLVVNTRDIADTGKFVAPYRISAIIADQNYFRLSFNRFAWEDNNQLGFVYDMFSTTPGNYFFNLFFQKGFELEEKRLLLDDVVSQLPWGKHTGRIVVEDNFGNHSEGQFVLFKVKKPEIEIQNVRSGAGQISLDIKRMTAQDADEINIQLLNQKNRSLYSGKVAERIITDSQNFILKGIQDRVCFLDFIFYKSKVPYYKKRFLLDYNVIDHIEDVEFSTYINRDDIVIQLRGYEFSTQNILLNVIQEGKTRMVFPEDSIDGIFFHFKPLNTHNDILLDFILLEEQSKIKNFQKHVKVIYLQNGVRQIFHENDFSAEFDRNTVKEPQVLKFELKSFSSDYPIHSRQVSLSPYHFPFLDMVRYKFKKDLPKPKQLGIFKYNFRRRRWRYVYTTYDPHNKIYGTKVISSGTFALMRDIYYPKIQLMRLKSSFVNKLKILVVKITDKGKGVDDLTLKVTLNRKRVECEYDPDWRHVLIENLNALKPGNNILKVQVADRGGNRSSRIFYIRLR